MAAHELDAAQVHKVWDNSIAPRLWIDSGDTINVQQPFLGHALSGPVGIHGARRGQVLQVDMLGLETWSWGYTLIAPGRGLLAADFPDAFFQPWDLADGCTAALRPDVVIPLAPFFGVLGNAPSETGQHSTIPPTRVFR